MSADTHTRGKIFRDPVHGLIRVEPDDQFLLKLIDTPEFQRLRRVRQLGVSFLTYPGAEHSRFAHSLGVLNFAQRILGIIKLRYHNESTVGDLLDQHSKEVKAAALLHDIGHGPFSHMAERAFDARGRHEEKTVELITAPKGIIGTILSSAGVDPEGVANLITKASPHRLLVDVVSSQLDADRMDYILRDSLATGVKYGAFDSEWLLNSLCIGAEPNQPASKNPNEWRLCLDERRGLHSAEQLILARMHMSLQVYFHQATRGWEAHLLCLFKEAAALAAAGELPKSTPGLAVEFFRRTGNVDAKMFLDIDEATLTCAMQQWAISENAGKLRDLASTFLRREKRYRCFELPKSDYRKTIKLSAALREVGAENHDWLLDSSDLVSYEDFDSVFRGTKQTPAEISTHAVLLSEGKLGAPSRPVEADSIILRAMGDHPIHAISRLYCHQDVVGNVEKVLAEIEIF
jgi:uncharacterized protein